MLEQKGDKVDDKEEIGRIHFDLYRFAYVWNSPVCIQF